MNFNKEAGVINTEISRREFIEISTAGTLVMALSQEASAQKEARTLRIGIVGTDNRGCYLLST